MSERMLKVKACEHKERTTVFSCGDDAPGRSLDTIEQCNTCGAVIHDVVSLRAPRNGVRLYLRGAAPTEEET